MARRYRRKSKRSYRKKFSRKRRMGKGEFGVRYMKLKRFLPINTDAGGVINFNIQARDPSSCPDWASCFNLFDEYRVCAVGIKYIPKVPAGNSSTQDYAPLALTLDSNTVTLTPISITDLMEYENCKIKTAFRPWKYYTRIPKLAINGNTNGWGPTSTPVTTGTICTFGSGFDVSTLEGWYFITYYLKFRARK